MGVMFLCGLMVALVGLMILLIDGEVTMNFDGSFLIYNETVSNINGLDFLKATDPWPVMHMTNAFIMSALIMNVLMYYFNSIKKMRLILLRLEIDNPRLNSKVPYIINSCSVIAGASIFETFEYIAGTVLMQFLKETSGDGLVGDMVVAWIAAAIICIVYKTAFATPDVPLFLLRSTGQNILYALLLLGVMSVHWISVFGILTIEPILYKVGFYASINVQIAVLATMWMFDHNVIMKQPIKSKRKATMKDNVSLFYIQIITGFFIFWASTFNLSWYTYGAMCVGALIYVPLSLAIGALWKM